MYPGEWARRTPDKPAIIMAGSGETVSYRELDERSNQFAQLLWSHGLRRGDHLAVLVENCAEFYTAAWAALRSGLYLTPINHHLGVDEAGYIVDNCDAKAFVTSVRHADVAEAIVSTTPKVELRLMVGGASANHVDFAAAVADQPTGPLTDEPAGTFMFYSSGTTGRPKGILATLPAVPISDGLGLTTALMGLYGFTVESVYLSPAPLYHAAPCAWSNGMLSFGGTIVVMEHFDAEAALDAIERYRITHSQWVPTMFVRMLKLPADVRGRYDMSSLQCAIHAAAPCPVDVKRQMIEWWGPVVHEYYAASEGTGFCAVGPEEWLAHPGTVGKALIGEIRICNEAGELVPVGETGVVYFELPQLTFVYHGDEEKTKDTRHPVHPNWGTVGDMGYVDDEGYLYLTDRKSFMIISGGVNIYPREIEDVLIGHPAVADVAVIGVPNEEFGEEVKAVVQLAADIEPSDTLAAELIELSRSRLAHFKCPRSVDFVDDLPRMPTGKLKKGLLRDRYWSGRTSRIV